MSRTPMSDQLRREMEKKKKKRDPKDELKEVFNEAGLQAMKSFISNMQTGAVQIDDSADVYRLFQMFMQLNDLSEGGEGSGALPKLPNVQTEVFSDLVEKQVRVEDGEEVEEDVINLSKFEDMSDEEVEEMLKKRERDLNIANEGGASHG